VNKTQLAMSALAAGTGEVWSVFVGGFDVPDIRCSRTLSGVVKSERYRPRVIWTRIGNLDSASFNLRKRGVRVRINIAGLFAVALLCVPAYAKEPKSLEITWVMPSWHTSDEAFAFHVRVNLIGPGDSETSMRRTWRHDVSGDLRKLRVNLDNIGDYPPDSNLTVGVKTCYRGKRINKKNCSEYAVLSVTLRDAP